MLASFISTWVRRLAFLALTGCGLAGTGAGYRVDVWQTDEGLPHNTVTALVQTRDGYLWLGTQSGLVRFDGVKFVVFDTHNTPLLPSDRIVQLLEEAGLL